jgi:hypothetical protein
VRALELFDLDSRAITTVQLRLLLWPSLDGNVSAQSFGKHLRYASLALLDGNVSLRVLSVFEKHLRLLFWPSIWESCFGLCIWPSLDGNLSVNAHCFEKHTWPPLPSWKCLILSLGLRRRFYSIQVLCMNNYEGKKKAMILYVDSSHE